MERFERSKQIIMESPKIIRTLLLNVILPLFTGGFIYLLFRSERLIMFDWIRFLGFKESLDLLRNDFNSLKSFIPNWVLFSLPDGLWVYSFSSAIIIIWNDNRKVLILLLTFPLIFGPAVELLQFFKLFKGTFDIIDLTLTIVAFIISVNINLKSNQYENQVC
jgi:hypothetical protein